MKENDIISNTKFSLDYLSSNSYTKYCCSYSVGSYDIKLLDASTIYVNVEA